MMSFAQKINYRSLKNGDFIFVGAEKENLSGAINRVTQTKKDFAFDHIGIIEIENDSIFVLHASSKLGSIRENLHSFYQSQKSKTNSLVIFRLKSSYKKSIQKAIETAKTMLGKPYNWSYILNEESFYCSDFVERAFRQDHIFVLEPMSFINPSTGKIDDYWIQFYKKQNLEVPQGKLGCNPNGLSSSKKIQKIAELILD